MVAIAIAPALYFSIGLWLAEFGSWADAQSELAVEAKRPLISQSDSVVSFPPPEPPFEAPNSYVRREEYDNMLEFVTDAMESMAAWTQSIKDCLMFKSCYNADFYNPNQMEKVSSPSPPLFPEPPIPPFPSPSPSPPEPDNYEGAFSLQEKFFQWSELGIDLPSFTRNERKAQRLVDKEAALMNQRNVFRKISKAIFNAPFINKAAGYFSSTPSPSPYPNAGHWEEELVYQEEPNNGGYQLTLTRDVNPPEKELAVADTPPKLAPYQCSPLGFRCADMFRIIAVKPASTMFLAEDAAQKACDEEPRCVSYDVSTLWGMAYLCRTNRVQTDKSDNYKVCQRGPFRHEMLSNELFSGDHDTYDSFSYGDKEDSIQDYDYAYDDTYYASVVNGDKIWKIVREFPPADARNVTHGPFVSKKNESFEASHKMDSDNPTYDESYDYSYDNYNPAFHGQRKTNSYDNTYNKNRDEFVKFLFSFGAE